MRRLDSPVAIVLTIGGLYVGQSIIGGVTFSALPSVLRERGISLDHIGLTYLAVVPWVLKFLWAPALERYRLPRIGPSRSRSIVLVGGLISAAGLVLAGIVGPVNVWPIMATFMMIAFTASTVDIACDGHAVESLSQQHHGWGNAAQVGGAYLGAAIGSGLFLVLVAQVDWMGAMLVMAVLLGLLGLPFLLSPASKPEAMRTHQPSLREALGRLEMRKGFALAALYAATQKWGLVMLGPFLVDAGLDLASLGVINGLGGMILGVACALLGGACVRFWGARPDALSEGRSLLETRLGGNGRPNPMFDLVRYLPQGEHTVRQRKLCCLRYLLPDVECCGSLCPSPPAKGLKTEFDGQADLDGGMTAL
ncbi:MFS transporter [Microvirga sp. BT689]|uniref:MFS transporter n=1 Tax=Microvirga arvi TaxID=2778731 RepID=UPI0019529D0F|nr:MFS transporter [Microvirga arvi]MBM6581518.1 MFS transporter [Microvirga arvi]